MSRPNLILTRPQPEALLWQQFFTRHGWHTQTWPLIEIEHLGAGEHQLAAVWQGLSSYRAAMFVSRAAVQHFFAHRPAQVPWPGATRAWCTGPGTRQALLAQGLTLADIDHPAPDCTWDSEHLWPVVSGQVSAGCRVLFVRGTDQSPEAVLHAAQGVGHDWLSRQVASQGAEPGWAVAYRRVCPVWDAAQTELARRAACDGSVWVFTSSLAVKHLGQLLDGQDWNQAKALATHPRIARQAEQLGFARVQTCQPSSSAVLASLES